MASETPPSDLMSVDAARAAIIADIAPLAREDIALTDGLGRVLAEPLVARRSQPPMAVSAMDGFAARSADVAAVPAVLTQIGAVQAGGAF
ncbi:MAG: molybdopterin molybdenumtransferase MoeA, partial [Pseudomonadota bacterium]|nr:molybdopterin molybdenumtransferase MoeA [Pseudomonadota bacterium]